MANVTNLEFSKEDQAFKKACTQAKIKPTKRQAGKYRRKCGLAYQSHRWHSEDIDHA